MLVHKRKLTQKDKHKIRASSDFKQLKRRLIEKYGDIDYITGKPLITDKMTCHHLDLNPEKYADYSNEDNFIMLNESTHRLLHQLYNFYENDKDILDKLKEVMDKMDEIKSKNKK